MQAEKIKIVNIAGYERSGTTLLHNVLGQVPNFFSVGELAEIWELNILDQRPCGCGKLLNSCPVWSRLLDELTSEFGTLNIQELMSARKKIRNRHLLKLSLPRQKEALIDEISRYLEITEKIYSIIPKITNSRVIFDTSKVPFYFYMLNQSSSFEIYTLHLIRDPRSVEYSILKRKQKGHPRYKNHNSILGSFKWLFLNFMLESYSRVSNSHYLRIRFSDFIEDPIQTLDNIAAFIDEKGMTIPKIESNKIILNPTHSTNGSPSRFNTGSISLEMDEDWLKKMPLRNRLIVGFLTWPMMKRYNINIR